MKKSKLLLPAFAAFAIVIVFVLMGSSAFPTRASAPVSTGSPTSPNAPISASDSYKEEIVKEQYNEIMRQMESGDIEQLQLDEVILDNGLRVEIEIIDGE